MYFIIQKTSKLKMIQFKTTKILFLNDNIRMNVNYQ